MILQILQNRCTIKLKALNFVCILWIKSINNRAEMRSQECEIKIKASRDSIKFRKSANKMVLMRPSPNIVGEWFVYYLKFSNEKKLVEIQNDAFRRPAARKTWPYNFRPTASCSRLKSKIVIISWRSWNFLRSEPQLKPF